jgi:quercetin dioxygenase-like cupin family protein
MSENIQDFIVRSSQKQWQPLVEKGVNYANIYVKTLRFDENAHRSPTILLKFEAGATYPYHNHPAGEEIFVLEGSCMIEGAKLSAGDYLYTPPQYKHAVKSETGCILFFIVPEEVEIL